jgi:hypothetical protein
MKLRHLLPWIPLLGVLWVVFGAQYLFVKHYDDNCLPGIKYTWGSNWAYTASMIFQLIMLCSLAWVLPD